MSKYKPLWDYIYSCKRTKIILTFEKIEQIGGVPIDHSFLRYKKELTEYGYAVSEISMKEQKVKFESITQNENLVLYIHGKGGTADEAEHYKYLFPDYDVIGLDYKAKTPMLAKEEFPREFQILSEKYSRIILIANSIGAYFAMCSLPQKKLERAFLISPIVDMEKLICDMMKWAGVSESDLHKKGTVETTFGETLSWEYLCFVRKHPIDWNVPTAILYGKYDNLTSKETITAFSNAHKAQLTMMENGEHWFHTPEQMAFLDQWITENK